MTEEEKKAIEWLKKADWFSARLYAPTILYLIDKQQKEIEELKKDKLELINKHHVVHLKDVEKELREMRKAIDTKNAEIECLNVIHESYKEMVEENNYISKDKIKAKIEEIKNDCKKCRFRGFCKDLLKNNQCSQGEVIKVLNKLLEDKK